MFNHTLKFTILDDSAINIKNDCQGTYFMIDEICARIPPHSASSCHFFGESIISAIISDLHSIGIGVLSAYLYDLIKNGKIKNLSINGKDVGKLSDINDALKNGQDN